MISPRTRKRDGRRVYDVRLRDPGGKTYNRTFETKRAAQDWEASERTARARSQWVDPRTADTPFEAVAAHWLASNTIKRGGSIARDRTIIATHLNPVLGSYPVVSITPAHVQALVNGWAARYAPSTVGRHYTTLQAIMSWAVDAEIVGRNPCRRTRLPRAVPRTSRILDGAELERLAGAMGDYGPMVYLGAAGLRWGEAAGLRVGRLDLLRHRITIDAQRTRGEAGRMIDGDPKSRAGHRSFSIPQWLVTMLSDHLAARGLTGADADELVFVSPGGAPLHYSNWRRRTWAPAVAEAGLVGFRFHDLRHTAATALVADGVDIKSAQSRLGHTAQVMLRVYAQSSEAADRVAAEKFGDRFAPGTRDGRAMDAPRSARRPTRHSL